MLGPSHNALDTNNKTSRASFVQRRHLPAVSFPLLVRVGFGLSCIRFADPHGTPRSGPSSSGSSYFLSPTSRHGSPVRPSVRSFVRLSICTGWFGASFPGILHSPHSEVEVFSLFRSITFTTGPHATIAAASVNRPLCRPPSSYLP